MKHFKNPSWWTTEDEAGWERVKAPLKRGWDERQRDIRECRSPEMTDTGRTSVRGEPVYDLELAYRFGHGARLHFGRKQLQWNADLEKCLRADWITLYPSRAENWENDFKAISFGWNYNETAEGDANDSGNYESIDRRPLKQSHQFYEANSRQNEATATRSVNSVQESCRPKSRHRILVVEDDNDLRRLNTEALLHHGYHVDAAEDGVLAWKRLGAQNYDLMITDNQMPNMTGVELLNKLHGCGLALPTLMVTSEVPWDEFQKHPWIEPAEVLSKPYTVRQLVEKVRKILGMNAPREVISPP